MIPLGREFLPPVRRDPAMILPQQLGRQAKSRRRANHAEAQVFEIVSLHKNHLSTSHVRSLNNPPPELRVDPIRAVKGVTEYSPRPEDDVDESPDIDGRCSTEYSAASSSRSIAASSASRDEAAGEREEDMTQGGRGRKRRKAKEVTRPKVRAERKIGRGIDRCQANAL